MSGNVITETWLAWAFDAPAREGALDAALSRVGAHYGPQLAEPPPLRTSVGHAEGLALWRHDDERLRWPAWSERDGVTACYASVPVDWRRVIDEPDPAMAADRLAREIADRPERLARLSPPLLVGVHERREGQPSRLLIANDFAGAGRLYELRFEAGPLGPGGYVWSNRLGALPVFAGIPAEADRRSWLLWAAAGWFISDATSLAGAVKVPPGRAIRIEGTESGASVERTDAGVLAAVLGAREPRYEEALEAAAEDALALASGIAALYEDVPMIDLSGGRDSRVSAAAAIAAGIDCELRTGDNTPGELDIALQLVAASPREAKHRVTRSEQGQPTDDLLDRLRAIHLVHDGMRNPQEIRRPMSLPIPIGLHKPSMSGHGGEIAHGFYYTSEQALRKIEAEGDAGLLARMDKAARRKAPAAISEAYELHKGEIERIFDEGRALGIEGPTLLDWFYLVQRLSYRSGLGARSNRYSGCATPGFVRAAFDLTPDQRVESRLHVELVSRLVPEWADVPFLNTKDKPNLPEIARDWIWDKPGHAERIDEIIAAGGSWTQLFGRRRVRRMWKQARRGRGHRHYETIFNRVAWREVFDDHLRTLTAAATSE